VEIFKTKDIFWGGSAGITIEFNNSVFAVSGDVKQPYKRKSNK
jgi:hypothetical protein